MLKHLLKARTPSIGVSFDTNMNLPTHSNKTYLDLDRSVLQGDIRLPRIKIESFDGNYSEWPSFDDQYFKAVHNIELLTNVNKFQYLKTLLKGEAADLLRHLPMTDESYVEAWEKLLKRFDRKKNIVKDYIDLFMNQANVNPSSTKTLRTICDTTDQVLRGIRSLGSDWEGRNPWLLYLLLKKLDPETQQLWAIHSNDTVTPTIFDLLDFLTNRCDALESTTIKRPTSRGSRHDVKIHASTNDEIPVNFCKMCKRSHPLYRCYKFKGLKPIARRKFVVNNKLCENCLKSGHLVNDCNSKRRCVICAAKHSTFLHVTENTPINHVVVDEQAQHCSLTKFNSNNCNNEPRINSMAAYSIKNKNQMSDMTRTMIQPEPISSNGNSQMSGLTTSYVAEDLSSRALLSTVQCYIIDNNNQKHKVKALLDSGSQSTLITESLAERLAIRRFPTSCSISGLAAKTSISARGCISLQLASIYCDTSILKVDALILPKLTTKIPANQINNLRWQVINDLKLADPQFSLPSHVDVILGNDVFLEILLPERFMVQPNLVAQHTIFGWVIGGKLNVAETNDNIQTLHTTIIENSEELDIIEKFWQLEEIGSPKPMKPQDKKCQEIYVSTTNRESNGRFSVRFSFKETPDALGLSYYNAERRLLAMERKFSKNPEFARQYQSFMLEYLTLGHMELIPEAETHCNEAHFYLPHHAVCKAESTTTKLRVVFDGSCKSSSSVSINDILLQGPLLQDELTSILLRFRVHSIAISADIEKMYRQVNIKDKDRDFQRIVWRNVPSNQIQHYRLKTVTYGITSAPFLAIRTMLELGNMYEKEFPVAAEILKRDFYVDDMLTGCEDDITAETIYSQMTQLLKLGGFNIRKFISNSSSLMKFIPIQDRASDDSIPFDDQPTYYKTLGLHWNPSYDVFQYKINLNEHAKLTKRNLLSEASRIFDPIGLVTPVTIRFKMLFQDVWKRKVEWDEPLPVDIANQWQIIKSSLPLLGSIRIKRCIKAGLSTNLELHIFCDASEQAYGAAAYLKSVDPANNIVVRLVAAKSRVAPINTISLPRLELCAAELGTKLYKYIDRALNLPLNHVVAWTDSQVVLAWLADHPSRWKSFVANRVSGIIESLPYSSWNYIESKSNPADYTSRGLTPQLLIDNQLWWSGPDILMKDRIDWPAGGLVPYNLIPEERKSKVLVNHNISTKNDVTTATNICTRLFDRYSSLPKIYRIICYVCRYYINSRVQQICRRRHLQPNAIGLCARLPPTPCELEIAENICIRWAQMTAFTEELKTLRQTKNVHRSSQLLALSPFIDENQIIRVGGRLSNANCEYNVKHPIILPKNNCLTRYLIGQLHMSHCHIGATTLMSIIRQRYWIVGRRNMVRYHILRCVKCFKLKRHHNEQLMGQLPEYRVTPGRVFLHTGVDYAGPIWIRDRSGRGPFKPIKGYIALFVCTRVKAIHIEVVSSLTTEAFMMALQRFISKRGKPIEILSDNGSNFVGVKTELNKLFDMFKTEEHFKQVSNFLTPLKIKFSFIPARSPHFGGLWEANIKSYKHLLLRSTGTAPLNFEQLYTVSSQIEAILNSRPICAQSESPDSFDALTPGHFLIGSPLTSIPEPCLEGIPVNRLSMYQNIQQRVEIFWKRWSKDYLISLQQRQKWKVSQPNIKPNQLVLVREDNLPKGIWLLGRIIKVHPGEDGKVRVATIKTPKGEVTRSIVKIVPLPIDEPIQSNTN